MDRWLDRPGYIALIAFAGGGIVATLVVLIIVLSRGGDGDTTVTLLPTATQEADLTPGATDAVTPTTGVTTTPTPGAFADAEDALAAFVRDELGSTYIGECPASLAPDEEPPGGICSVELYRSAELVTFNIGPFAAEALGEAVITPDANGAWTLAFLEFPELDQQLTVGGLAMVFQAQDCLRFHSEPGANSEVLTCQIDGTRARVTDGPVDADGFTWWELEGYGWGSSEFLAPVAS